jgi:hypothetical protein
VSVSATISPLVERVEVRRRAYVIRDGAQHAEQAVGALATENPDREIERHALDEPRNGDAFDANLGLGRAGPVDDDEPPRGRRRIDRLQRRNLALLPASKSLSAAANASSAFRSPTMASSELFGTNQVR